MSERDLSETKKAEWGVMTAECGDNKALDRIDTTADTESPGLLQ